MISDLHATPIKDRCTWCVHHIIVGGIKRKRIFIDDVDRNNLTEEEYSLILKEINCTDPFRIAVLNVYRDVAMGKIK